MVLNEITEKLQVHASYHKKNVQMPAQKLLYQNNKNLREHFFQLAHNNNRMKLFEQ